MLSSTPNRWGPALNRSLLKARAASLDLMDEFVFGRSSMLAAPGIEPCNELVGLYDLTSNELKDAGMVIEGTG